MSYGRNVNGKSMNDSITMTVRIAAIKSMAIFIILVYRDWDIETRPDIVGTITNIVDRNIGYTYQCWGVWCNKSLLRHLCGLLWIPKWSNTYYVSYEPNSMIMLEKLLAMRGPIVFRHFIMNNNHDLWNKL